MSMCSECDKSGDCPYDDDVAECETDKTDAAAASVGWREEVSDE